MDALETKGSVRRKVRGAQRVFEDMTFPKQEETTGSEQRSHSRQSMRSVTAHPMRHLRNEEYATVNLVSNIRRKDLVIQIYAQFDIRITLNH